MRVLTDYRQWYDAAFDGQGPTFERMAFTRGGLEKRDQFALFERLGLTTPPHGLVKDLAICPLPFGGDSSVWRSEVDCVVYHDELAHQGKGKERLRLTDALERWPDRYASLFIPAAGNPVTLRHGRIGRIGVWIRQTSATDWRTNVHEEERALSREHHADHPIPRVLWAIDFLPSPWGLLAIDFNTAPDLDTAGELVSAEEVRAELLAAPQDHLLQP